MAGEWVDIVVVETRVVQAARVTWLVNVPTERPTAWNEDFTGHARDRPDDWVMAGGWGASNGVACYRSCGLFDRICAYEQAAAGQVSVGLIS